jgi:perosamine synthetase
MRTLPPAAAPIYAGDIISGFKGLLRGHKELLRFESELKEYFGAKHCFLVSSGKAALTLILKALKDIYPYRDEVLIPAFTCYSVPSSIVRAGLKVRLCDIDPKTLDFDFNQLSEILNSPSSNSYELSPMSSHPSPMSYELSAMGSSKLLAIIPVHLYGLPANIDRLREAIEDPCVTIIEDAAQCIGGEGNCRKLGTLGDVSFFSLGRGKALSTAEGGIVLTNNDEIAEKLKDQSEKINGYRLFDLIRLILNSIAIMFFLNPSLYWFPKSIPFLRLGDTIYDPEFKIKKMSTFQAGLATGWQRKLKKFQAARSRNSKFLLNNIKQTLVTQVTQQTQSTFFPDLVRFPIIISDDALRRRVLEESERRGLGIMPGYPDSIDGIKELASHFKGGHFPKAKEISGRIITLPIHPFVTSDDLVRIVSLISHTVK